MVSSNRKQAFDFVQAVHDLSTETAVAERLGVILSQFGFEYFIITGLPMPGLRLEPLVMAARWPDGWWEQYMDGNYIRHDPVGQHCYRTHRLFAWNDAPITDRIKEYAPRIMKEAAAHGMAFGMSLPVHSEDGFQACVSFAGPRLFVVEPEDYAALEMIAYAAHGRLRFIRGDRLRRDGALTAREREVLCWTAAGKTKWEIGCILSVSEHTVDKHLRAAAAKLHAVNKTQAAVEAIRYGQIAL